MSHEHGSASISDEFFAVDTPTLYRGYVGACARFQAAEDARQDVRETFYPMFEALNWAVSLEDQMRELKQPLTGNLVRGIRCVRNRVHHQWAAAVVPKEVLTALIPFTFPRWFWKPLDRLPKPPARHHRSKDDWAYVSELEGKYVRDTLRALQDVFDAQIRF